eukprot:3861079-Rhodomonas_salina.2
MARPPRVLCLHLRRVLPTLAGINTAFLQPEALNSKTRDPNPTPEMQSCEGTLSAKQREPRGKPQGERHILDSERCCC